MALDWSKIGMGSQEPLLRPRDIFADLPNRPWPYLRLEQGEVLEKWFDRRSDRDVVIKQNTGGGKTVAGLLIAQSTLNEGIGKAVYLAPDTYLASRVRHEADRLGLVTVTEPRDADFHAQEAILVTTFHKLVNGRSQFGVAGDGKEPFDLGVIVVDDAHAALTAAEGQFRLAIPSSHDAYGPLLDMFEADLREQSAKAWEDILAGDYTASQRIPFWSWADKRAEVMKELHKHRDSEPFLFTWPLVADVLHLCHATVTSRGIEIRPPVPPISMIPSFVNAKRRVYLTATLADDSVLVSDLNVDPAMVKKVVTPGSASDLGDRMILAPVALNPSLDDAAIRLLAKQFSEGDRDGDGQPDARPVNVVVLVPSDKAAAAWESHADRTFHVKDLETGVAELIDHHVGLVVLVNKYDGIDLPRTACELLIIDGVPTPMDGMERREALALTNSPIRRIREAQRIEQGMGRGVRDNEDHCAVLLLGADLALATRDPQWLSLFSPATRAQLQLSHQVAAQIKNEGLPGVRTAISACLDREEHWVRASRRALAEVRYEDTGTVREEALAARRAFDLAAAGQTPAAAKRLQEAINGLEDLLLRGVLREQKAAYLHFTNAEMAQQQQGAAVRDNPVLLRPIVQVDAPRLRVAAAQAMEAATFLATEYANAVDLVLGVRALLDEITWDKDRTDQAEAAWERLGLHLGFASTRPDKYYGIGPDNLWGLTEDRHAVVELKTGCSGNTIDKDHVDQLGGSVRWDRKRHPGVTSEPVMLHPSPVVDKQATPVPGMRVITPDKLDQLKEAVRDFSVALANGQGSWGDEQAVAAQLAKAKLTPGNFVNTYSVAAQLQA